MPETKATLEKITSLAKRRGFVFPSNEIYGGFAAVYDFGPLGVLLRNNIRNEWWKHFVLQRDDVVGIETAILTKREVLQASGHESSFVDPLVECKKCHQRFRADHVKEAEEGKRKIRENKSPGANASLPGNELSSLINLNMLKCPEGGVHTFLSPQDLEQDLEIIEEPRSFNLMFKTYVGPTASEEDLAYLRPETAQGMFTNFKNVLDTTRIKIPFGIAQTGRAFRNEITTGEWIFRLRELEIDEIEFFVKPGTDDEWFNKWVDEWESFYTALGIDKDNIKRVEIPDGERAHYSKRTIDLHYNFPVGWKELAGIANRTDFDLSNHQKSSGQDLSYFDEELKERFTPYVIEPTMGLERAFLAVLSDAYREEEKDGKTRIYLALNPKIAPVKAAVFPLLANKPELVAKAQEVYKSLKEKFGSVAWDDRGNIGKRYLSQDEIGTPFCITIDFDSLQDASVTIRHRDTAEQERLKISELSSFLSSKLR